MNIDEIIILPYKEFIIEVDILYGCYLSSSNPYSDMLKLRKLLDVVEGKDKRIYIFDVLYREQMRNKIVKPQSKKSKY